MLLVALLRSRRHFVAPGDPATLVPLLQVAAALAFAVPILVVGIYDARRVLAPHRGGARAARRRARLPRALAVAAAAGRAARRRGGARARGRARAGARHRQPRVLRPAPRQELLLLAERPLVPRLPRRRRDGARRRRPDRRRRRAPRARARVRPRRAREGLARRGRRRGERGARGLRVDRLQVDVPRRRGGHPAGDVLARRARDPEGAPVGLAAREVRLSRRGAVDRGRRRAAAGTGARGLRGVARQLAGARLHDGDGRAVPLSGHRARGRRRPRRPRRRVPAARPLAGERGVLARVDAPPRRHAERADGVPDHRDGRVGAAARRHRAVAQLRGLRRLPALRRRRDARSRARCAGCS